MKDIDRFRGCLIGGAAGDALGYTVEFRREQEIFSKYGEKGITEYDLQGDERAEISDDTQMTLFTAAGLMAAGARGDRDGYAAHIYRSYLDWLRTQRQTKPLPEEERYTWLAGVPELYDQRAPGVTCQSALQSGRPGTIERPLNRSKGCGGVMRAAPVGLYFADRPEAETAARIGAAAAALTHGHILGWLPAAALAQTVWELCRGGNSVREAVTHSMETVKAMWSETEERDYFVAMVGLALDLAGRKPVTDLEAIHRLGEGWVGEEALAIAVFCAARYEDNFDRAITAAVNHKGDSDSTGAVAGNILGAKLGLAGIPAKYTERLELRDVILQVADDLYSQGKDAEGNPDPAWAARYGGAEA